MIYIFSEVGVGRGGVVRRGRGHQGYNNDFGDLDCGPDARAYACAVCAAARICMKVNALDSLDLLKKFTNISGGINL